MSKKGKVLRGVGGLSVTLGILILITTIPDIYGMAVGILLIIFGTMFVGIGSYYILKEEQKEIR